MANNYHEGHDELRLVTDGQSDHATSCGGFDNTENMLTRCELQEGDGTTHFYTFVQDDPCQENTQGELQEKRHYKT